MYVKRNATIADWMFTEIEQVLIKNLFDYIQVHYFNKEPFKIAEEMYGSVQNLFFKKNLFLFVNGHLYRTIQKNGTIFLINDDCKTKKITIYLKEEEEKINRFFKSLVKLKWFINTDRLVSDMPISKPIIEWVRENQINRNELDKIAQWFMENNSPIYEEPTWIVPYPLVLPTRRLKQIDETYFSHVPKHEKFLKYDNEECPF